MTIKAVNSSGTINFARSSSKVSSKISEDTKKKLIALGLSPCNYANETDAKAAITAKELQKQQNANELAQPQAAKSMAGATALGNYNKASLGL